MGITERKKIWRIKNKDYICNKLKIRVMTNLPEKSNKINWKKLLIEVAKVTLAFIAGDLLGIDMAGVIGLL